MSSTSIPQSETSLITTPKEYTAALQKWVGHYHVMAPFTNLTALAPQHGIIASQVLIDPDTRPEGANEVYGAGGGVPWLKGDEVALAKRGLRKLAECAGISYRTERTDPRTIPHYWEVKAIATYKGVDGSLVQREATMEWDLRDGSNRLKGFSLKQTEEARKNGLRNCEARAINAVIRECGCGLKQKYTKAELSKPFLMLRVAFQPDMSDPEVRRQVTEHHLAGTAALYPPARQTAGQAQPLDTFDAPDEPRVVGRSTVDQPADVPAAVAQSGGAGDDEPPTEDAVRIVKVDSKSGEKNGRKWTRYLIVDSRGVEHSTFERSLYDAAKEFVDKRTWVEVIEEQDGNYRNLVEIAPAGQQPKLDLPAPGDL